MICFRHSWCRHAVKERALGNPVVRVVGLLLMVALTYPLGFALATILIAVLP